MKTAVLIPCLNEEEAITKVVQDFVEQLPGCVVYVYDNGSTDRTIEVAKAAGAVVASEKRRGKGNVVSRMFADVDADIYVLVDGDDTYEATAAPAMVERLLSNNLDMVVGIRDHKDEDEAYRSGHQTGNAIFNKFLGMIFEKTFTDIFSGYRVFSRRFVKSFPCLSRGFEIEMEMSIHSITARLPVEEMATTYGKRPEGSHSKLNTYRDGMRIFLTMLRLFKHIFPFKFYAGIGAVLAFVSLSLGIPLVGEWLLTGLVPKLPTAVLAASVGVIACLSVAIGIILDCVSRGHMEMRRLEYLNFTSPAVICPDYCVKDYSGGGSVDE
ncbi:Glycosyltransferase involved in cell wall bisynthesis [Maridesulfovibrio ferrireducens]|uniref:Glycosyltransferase involved in cell wall bisynthesis n=1 Tax=Maridesulfovibrio ferrireducens TaxID=246191 RepID=A0A1G9CKH5_9BACT|nr:glycosyltransferase family 2 protein [Maridesulfovibrio ferrireducens]SDK52128.1 Glycosyltransferase involved in cell wall bisynthesis [Maridesulfovibrio ferrireducens]